MVRKWLSLLVVGVVIAGTGVTLVQPAGAGQPVSSVPVCIKPGTDFRAPYNQGLQNGQCPQGFAHEYVVPAAIGPNAVAVCIRPSTDWRAPYNQGAQNGNCPQGYAKTGILQQQGGIKACIKPSLDVRAPYSNGTCPDGFAAHYLARGAASDQDQDGYVDEQDCAPTNPDINPGATDIPNDGIDQNCDGQDLIVGDGEVRATLTWDSADDMDIHVIDPSNERISWDDKTSTSGGTLDRDDNIGVCGTDPEPGGVENIFWPPNGAPAGTYTVEAYSYNDCSPPGTNWRVQVFVNGVIVIDQTGTTGGGGGGGLPPSPGTMVFQQNFAVT